MAWYAAAATPWLRAPVSRVAEPRLQPSRMADNEHAAVLIDRLFVRSGHACVAMERYLNYAGTGVLNNATRGLLKPRLGTTWCYGIEQGCAKVLCP